MCLVHIVLIVCPPRSLKKQSGPHAINICTGSLSSPRTALNAEQYLLCKHLRTSDSRLSAAYAESIQWWQRQGEGRCFAEKSPLVCQHSGIIFSSSPIMCAGSGWARQTGVLITVDCTQTALITRRRRPAIANSPHCSSPAAYLFARAD